MNGGNPTVSDSDGESNWLRSEQEFSRRKLMALVGTAAILSLETVLGIHDHSVSTPTSQAAGQSTNFTSTTALPETAETTAPETATATATETQSPMFVDIREFGAAVDGITDDTEAFLDALNAVPAGGTVFVPPGDTVISPRHNRRNPEDSKAALPIERPTDGLTIRGAGSGRKGSRLVMGPDHTDNHKALEISASSEDSSDDERQPVTIRDLTIDGMWQNQGGADSNFPNGFGIHVNRTTGPFRLQNCILRGWSTNGALLSAAGVSVDYCTFERNGHGALQDGNRGHGFNANPPDGGSVTATNCVFRHNSGEGVDTLGGKLTVRNSVFRNNGWGVKLNPGVEAVTLEHCKMVDSSYMHIHCVPSGDEGTGRLRLHSVVLEKSTWPAISLNQRPGTLEGDKILIRNANSENQKNSAISVNAYSQLGNRTLDIGTLSIHDVVGNAVHFEHAAGSIGTLKYSGTEGIGKTADVSLGTVTEADPIDVKVPSESDVGSISM